MASLDFVKQHLASTEYIFQAEDDWFFYRKSFIEDSLSIMLSNSNISTLFLRNLQFPNRTKHIPRIKHFYEFCGGFSYTFTVEPE